MPLLAILLQLDRVDALIVEHRKATRAEIPCEAPRDAGEVVVCGRRAADRYRAPLVAPGMADDAVFAERAGLLRDPMPKCGITGPFVVGCGHIGIGVSTSAGGTRLTTRKPAD